MGKEEFQASSNLTNAFVNFSYVNPTEVTFTFFDPEGVIGSAVTLQNWLLRGT